ncbi:group II intron maturase-specific domain-containing protein [Streptomyces sp. NPDC002514]|uniref:group II intron maturase-specific domain-containing protein n=1 Tax=Streptomyces sp. NPDC001270 TaxID=3364554 RepID=UPI0036AEA1A0
MESWKWRGRFYLQRWPSARAMRVLRDKVRAATGRSKTERPVAAVVAGLNPVLRGWAAYFRSGHSGRKFNAVDGYVHELLAVFASRETQTPRPELDHPVHLRIDYPARGLPPHRKRAQGDGACQSVNGVGKSCAGGLHARFEAAGAGNGAEATAPVPGPAHCEAVRSTNAAAASSTRTMTGATAKSLTRRWKITAPMK